MIQVHHLPWLTPLMVRVTQSKPEAQSLSLLHSLVQSPSPLTSKQVSCASQGPLVERHFATVLLTPQEQLSPSFFRLLLPPVDGLSEPPQPGVSVDTNRPSAKAPIRQPALRMTLEGRFIGHSFL
jgi:hypothetical protein